MEAIIPWMTQLAVDDCARWNIIGRIRLKELRVMILLCYNHSESGTLLPSEDLHAPCPLFLTSFWQTYIEDLFFFPPLFCFGGSSCPLQLWTYVLQLLVVCSPFQVRLSSAARVSGVPRIGKRRMAHKEVFFAVDMITAEVVTASRVL